MKRFALATILLFAAITSADEVKKADLAGSWYPRSKGELVYLLEGYLEDASPEIDGRIFAIISPHAGYRFSGPVAAYGFKAARNQNIKTVVLIGFAHRKYFDGISVYDRGSFETPLGEIRIDTTLAKDIIAHDRRIFFYPDAFNGENSIEMQIPFIQMVLNDAKIVPIAFGTQDFSDAEILAGALAAVLKDRDDYLIIASTDMSHYHHYDEANSIDRHTVSILNKMDAKELYDEVHLGISELCGFMPVTSTLLAAEKLNFGKMRVLKFANSGDTFGSKDSVVGYLSAAIYKEDSKQSEEKELPMLNEAQRKRLLQIARESITSFVRDGKRKEISEEDPVLNKPMGAFVTLHKEGELRGCIGNMLAKGPLYATVSDMAIQAATQDPRFQLVSLKEMDRIDIEISVLSPLKKVSSHKEVTIPGHGVLVRRGIRSGVYLPQVATETGWNKEEFLTSLCGQKAGLPPDAWKDPATEIYIFTAEIFGEESLKKGGAK